MPTRRLRFWYSVLSAGATALLTAQQAVAHGLGERYALPLPLDLYLAGAAVMVALSFAVLAIFPRAVQVSPLGGDLSVVSAWKLPTWLGTAMPVLIIRGLSVFIFVLLIAAGLFGSPDPFKNPLPVSVWVLGWIGLAYMSAALGNVWGIVNPWDNLFRACEWCCDRRRTRQSAAWARYPERLAAWPAVLMFLAFAWLELVWPARDHPASLAAVILVYSVVIWAGMAFFGRRAWLENGEFLTLAFGLLSRFAIVGRQDDRPDAPLILRPPAVGLLVSKPVRASVAAFALLMLTTVTFDGLLETPLWVAVSERALALRSLQTAGGFIGVDAYLLITTAALVGFSLAFAAIYLLVARLMVGLAGDPAATTSEIARLFALTIVPIAIGYHLAHYLSYLLIAGQFIVPIASDPFARGWNLFGTRLYLIDFSVINARFVWYASLVLIVGGHIIAVWLAHVQAQRRFIYPHAVRRSQAPMLVLMVGYTALSLWILAQPIVRAPS